MLGTPEQGLPLVDKAITKRGKRKRIPDDSQMISFRLPPELMDGLERIAAANYEGIPALIRRIIKQYLMTPPEGR